jgi:hypothetical protein
MDSFQRLTIGRHMAVIDNCIWFWNHGDKNAGVGLVNDKYRYKIYLTRTGQCLAMGNADTLPLAKQEVFRELGSPNLQ